MEILTVVAGVIIDENQRIFCTKRKNKGELANKWEFPGGKVEAEETHEEALIREFKEELSIDISVEAHITSLEHCYKTFKVFLHAYKVRINSGIIKLNEHNDCIWISLDQINSLDWAEADYPIFEKLTVHMKR